MNPIYLSDGKKVRGAIIKNARYFYVKKDHITLARVQITGKDHTDAIKSTLKFARSIGLTPTQKKYCIGCKKVPVYGDNDYHTAYCQRFHKIKQRLMKTAPTQIAKTHLYLQPPDPEKANISVEIRGSIALIKLMHNILTRYPDLRYPDLFLWIEIPGQIKICFDCHYKTPRELRDTFTKFTNEIKKHAHRI